MYQLLIFILFTVISWLAVACLAKVLYISIQPGQWIDHLFDYQKKLNALDISGSFWAKPLGYCEVCFSHLIGLVSFPFYCIVLNYATHTWITDNSTPLWANIIINVVWFLAYDSISAIVNLVFITKV